jgi:hypothetical protein
VLAEGDRFSPTLCYKTLSDIFDPTRSLPDSSYEQNYDLFLFLCVSEERGTNADLSSSSPGSCSTEESDYDSLPELGDSSSSETDTSDESEDSENEQLFAFFGEEDDFSGPVETGTTPSAGPDHLRRIIMDSGTTNHVISDQRLYSAFEPAIAGEQLQGVGAPTDLLGRGEVFITLHAKNGCRTLIQLRDCLCIPGEVYLLSVKKFTAGGAVVTFARDESALMINGLRFPRYSLVAYTS